MVTKTEYENLNKTREQNRQERVDVAEHHIKEAVAERIRDESWARKRNCGLGYKY